MVLYHASYKVDIEKHGLPKHTSRGIESRLEPMDPNTSLCLQLC